MPITTTEDRARFLQFRQQHWSADHHAAHDAWRLYFLGFRSERIFHLVDAQRAAPAFVRGVLAHMAVPVLEDPRDGQPATH
ncbi:hypothetical protein WL58_16810 [Burkholderia cepacia]|uniref:hypothetical protein n=1 Tax=Burkholderia cepacia TaxID=292 RepID=UPI00075951DE|nr:hypothetical protein [Burkholderia cepacia]KWC84176.1 hypothetical protein WL58_16810 [Burkholderia cepacia]